MRETNSAQSWMKGERDKALVPEGESRRRPLFGIAAPLRTSLPAYTWVISQPASSRQGREEQEAVQSLR